MVTPKMLTCFLFGMVSMVAVTVEAQRPQRHWTNPARPLQGTGRFLGLGYSTGYHTRYHGSDTDYYQPYNARNSMRMAPPIENHWATENHWGQGWETSGSNASQQPMGSRGPVQANPFHPNPAGRPEGNDFQPLQRPSDNRLPEAVPIDSRQNQRENEPRRSGEPMDKQSQDLDLSLTGHSVLIKN